MADIPQTPPDTELSLEQLYLDLQTHLKTSGRLRTDPTSQVVFGREDGLTSLLHTPDAGPVEVTDYPSAEGHQRFKANQSETPDLDILLTSSSAILSISFGGELRKVASGDASGVWYMLGRRSDIRPRTFLSLIYNSAVAQSGEPEAADTDVVAFNMHEIVINAATSDHFKALIAGLSKVK